MSFLQKITCLYVRLLDQVDQLKIEKIHIELFLAMVHSSELNRSEECQGVIIELRGDGNRKGSKSAVAFVSVRGGYAKRRFN